MPARGQQFGVGDLPPRAAANALRHEDAIWFGAGPMVQAVGEAHRIFAERDFWPEINRAVVAALDRNRGIAERDRTQRGIAARGGGRTVGSRAHVRPASPWRSCGRGRRGSAVWLPCRFAPPSPSAIPSEVRSADWLPRSSAAPAAPRNWSAAHYRRLLPPAPSPWAERHRPRRDIAQSRKTRPRSRNRP